MWLDFFFENAHFALNLTVGGVFFSVFWLYADAWMIRKTHRELLKLTGYLLLSISFVLHATRVESAILTTSLPGHVPVDLLTDTTKLIGYLSLIISLTMEPLQDRPKHENGSTIPSATMAAPFAIKTVITNATVAPILAAQIGFLYMRQATLGLEHHIRRVAISFFLLSVAELLNLPIGLLAGTTNSDVYPLVAPFGPLWIVQHLTLGSAVALLSTWVFSYLLKRFQTQLFIYFTAAVLGIFLITTVTFTGLLLSNLQQETIRQLETDVRVLHYALERTKAQLISDAQSFAQNPLVREAIPAVSRKPLSDLAERFLLSKKQSTLVILNENGQVITRGEDRERFGDNLSRDPLVKRALAGESPASVVISDGIVAPSVSLYAVGPIKSGERLLGAVLMGVAVDSAFVDGIKQTTGLDSSIYAGTLVSATTLTAADGISRLTGIQEHNAAITTRVLDNGDAYAGSISLLSRPYLAAYLPLTDSDRVPVGMLFVGKPQSGIIRTAGKSIETTFIVAAALIATSILPSFLIARSLARQVR